MRIAPAGEAAGPAGGEALTLAVMGQDRPGIVSQVTAVLSGLGVNIETLRTWIAAEPHSGGALFNMAASVRLPVGVAAGRVTAALEAISAEIMVDVAVTAGG